MEKSIELIDIISNKIDIKNIDAGMQSPLVLAYIGDAIYDCFKKRLLYLYLQLKRKKLLNKIIIS